METNKNIQDKINSTLKSIEAIEAVTVSPFFKDKTMNKLFLEKEAPIVSTWFTPKLQLATLVCVVVLNIVAFSQMKTNTYDENINEFGETYGLISSIDSAYKL